MLAIHDETGVYYGSEALTRKVMMLIERYQPDVMFCISREQEPEVWSLTPPEIKIIRDEIEGSVNLMIYALEGYLLLVCSTRKGGQFSQDHIQTMVRKAFAKRGLFI